MCQDLDVDESWVNREFGARLRRIRQDAELTQEDLAELASISRTSVVNVEQGRQGVSVHRLYRLAQALNVAPAELLPPAPSADSPQILLGDTSDRGKHAVQAVLRRAGEDSTQR